MPHDGVDRYELVELLGRGVATEVHRAQDHKLDRPVAVKVFAAPLDEAAERRFDHEARALARLSHPGLVSLFDVGVVVSRPYLVMQLVEGESLASRLLSGPLPLADTLRMGESLADALAHAHSRGVVHRDVKPSNILLDHENTPHLTDFGIALLTGTNRLTSTNEIIGTPAYLAPEQILGADVGPPADVYALGLVLLECLKGDMEYSGGTRVEAALARLHRQPAIPATLPAGVADLLRSMTAAEPGSRPTAEECGRRLRSVDDTPLALGNWQPAPVTRAGRRRIAAAAAVTLAVACAGVVLALDTPQPHPAPHNVSEPHHVVQPTTTHAPSGTAGLSTAAPSTAQPSSARPSMASHPATVVNEQLPRSPAGPPPKGDKGDKGKGKNHGKGKGHGGDE